MGMSTMKIRCPHCSKSLKVPQGMAGKKAKCPACGNILPIPNEPTTSPANPCPQCGSPLDDDAVLCVHCGFNLKAGERMVTARGAADAPKGGDEYVEISSFHAISMGLRLGLMAACVGASLVIFAGAYLYWEGKLSFAAEGITIRALAVVGVWLLVCMLDLGTFERFRMNETQDGGWVLRRRKFICFLPVWRFRYRLADYDVIHLSAQCGVGMWGYLTMLGLCLFGLVPGLWWWAWAIRKPTVMVRLIKTDEYGKTSHGSCAYRGIDAGYDASELCTMIQRVTGFRCKRVDPGE